MVKKKSAKQLLVRDGDFDKMIKKVKKYPPKVKPKSSPKKHTWFSIK